MPQFVGLDVSLKNTFISIRQDGHRIWRGKCPSDPHAIAKLLCIHAPDPAKIVFESGPLATWYFHALTKDGLPAICIEARHAQKILGETLNKTDANDADGLARLAEAGFYKAVRVKSYDAMRVRTLVAARSQLLDISTQLTNQIRGLMKTFGLLVPKGQGRVFDGHVRRFLEANPGLAQIILPLLEAWQEVRARAIRLSRDLLAETRSNSDAQLLMTIPGIGAITATSYLAAIESPANFQNSRCVGAWVGLTTRRYQSGEADFDGHISRRGDRRLRALLYEAATALLTRTSEKTESSLKTWGLKLRERLGFKRAAVAVARKLAVIMHSMLQTGCRFDPLVGAPT